MQGRTESRGLVDATGTYRMDKQSPAVEHREPNLLSCEKPTI